jgi:hypothetical protein
MHATEEATGVVSVEDLRDRAVKTLERNTFLRIDAELEEINAAQSYAELLKPVTVVVSAFETHNYMLGPLKKVQTDIIEQLARIEQELAQSTSKLAQ